MTTKEGKIFAMAVEIAAATRGSLYALKERVAAERSGPKRPPISRGASSAKSERSGREEDEGGDASCEDGRRSSGASKGDTDGEWEWIG